MQVTILFVYIDSKLALAFDDFLHRSVQKIKRYDNAPPFYIPLRWVYNQQNSQ